MRAFIPFIIFGLTTGSVYGISAMGLVLTYKTSGVFNVGHGAVCAAGAYVFYDLRQNAGIPWPYTALLVIGVFGPLSGLLLERLAALLAPVRTAYKIVGSVGLLVAIQALITIRYTSQGLIFKTFLPQSRLFSIEGVEITADQLITFLLGVVAAVALAVFFRTTRLGIAMRAVVDDPQLLDMTGKAPAGVRRSAWVIGSSFAAASGVLFASTQAQLDVNVLSLLVVQAFGAATIARFQSLPMCFVGGLVVGIAQKIVSKEEGGHAFLQGLDLAVPFLILFIGLLVIPRRKLVEAGRPLTATPPTPVVFSAPVRRAGYAAGLVLLLVLPHLGFVGSHIPVYDEALTQVALFVSLHLLVRTSGQISLCHFGFAAIGAAGFAHFQGDGAPFLLAVVLGGLVCIPPALVVAVPAIRLSGLYLGLATLGFGILLSAYAYEKNYMFGLGGLTTRRPAGFGSDRRYYYLLLAFALAAVLVVVLVERSRLGRLLRALGDSPTALATHGLSVNVTRVLAFCISGFLAGTSGALYSTLFGSVSQNTFSYVNSLVALAVLAISGRSSVLAAFVAPALLYIVPDYISGANAASVLQMVFGLAAILVAGNSQGAFGRGFDALSARFDRRRVGPASARLARAANPRLPRAPRERLRVPAA